MTGLPFPVYTQRDVWVMNVSIAFGHLLMMVLAGGILALVRNMYQLRHNYDSQLDVWRCAACGFNSFGLGFSD
jgi:hypothetical protein